MHTLDTRTARHFATIALGHVAREYPNKLDQVLTGDGDALPPRALHPVFFGSFDWHSCVHGWWTLLRLRRLFPALPEAERITQLAETTFTPHALAGERAYLDRPSARGFERPYGWGWLLALHHEACLHPDAAASAAWGARLEPLARRFAQLLREYLAVLTYPITVGTHFNTAFALVLAREWAASRDPELVRTIDDWTSRTFAPRRDYQGWEPGGDEFLSPALIAALLMSRTRPPADFAPWFAAFLPISRLEEMFAPAIVSDRSDGKIAHLDGLNLSRAWCLRQIAHTLRADHTTPAPHIARIEALAHDHLDAALPHIAGDYMGEHWLATFALLALEQPDAA